MQFLPATVGYGEQSWSLLFLTRITINQTLLGNTMGKQTWTVQNTVQGQWWHKFYFQHLPLKQNKIITILRLLHFIWLNFKTTNLPIPVFEYVKHKVDHPSLFKNVTRWQHQCRTLSLAIGSLAAHTCQTYCWSRNFKPL